MTTFTKYGAFARIAARQAGSARGDLYGRVAFFAIILGVFSALWRAVGETGLPLAADARDLVWYLAATEWILLSVPPLHVDIESEIKRGDVAYQLVRPMSYLAAVMSQGIGQVLSRAPVLGVTALVCGLGFTGHAPPVRAAAFVLGFGLWAMVLIVAMHVVIGLLAFWVVDVSPLYWVWQKLLFILGGLMLPLSIYPEWLQRAALFTPFPWVLWGPASVLLGAGPGAWQLGLSLAMWTLVLLVAAELLFRRAVRALQVNGG